MEQYTVHILQVDKSILLKNIKESMLVLLTSSVVFVLAFFYFFALWIFYLFVCITLSFKCYLKTQNKNKILRSFSFI